MRGRALTKSFHLPYHSIGAAPSTLSGVAARRATGYDMGVRPRISLPPVVVVFLAGCVGAREKESARPPVSPS